MRCIKSFKGFLVLIAAITGVFFIRYGVYAQDESSINIYRKIKPPDKYGTIVMDREIKGEKNLKPVVFPHWAHRSDYSCKVCHADLGFKLEANTTEIKQSDIEAGKYCGKCHNGTTAFGVNECERCHSYGLDVKGNKPISDALKDLPKDDFGNRVNWAQALKEGKIKPRASIDGQAKLNVLDSDIIIPVTKYDPHPPDVLFPHKIHTEQMACDTCHPSIFNDKKGGNPDMNMMKIISGQYCGVCHGRVSFPLDDCFRCHSQPAKKWEPPKKDEKGAKPKK